MSRYPLPDIPVPSDDLASPGTTIVGGRPPEGRASRVPVPTGIQRLLRHASRDPSFLEALVEKRALAAEEAGVPLTTAERAILEAVSADALRGMARSLPPVPHRPASRQAATAAVLLLGGASLATAPGCGEPDTPAVLVRPDEIIPTEGILVDIPSEMAPPAGIAPDVPAEEDLPVEPASAAGITPDPPSVIPELDDAAVRDSLRLRQIGTKGCRADLPPVENLFGEVEPEPAPRASDGPPTPPDERPTEPLMIKAGGVAPDVPLPRPDTPSMLLEGGAAPDVPPERPESRPVETKGGAEPSIPETETDDGEKAR